jgi:hypothetical protein
VCVDTSEISLDEALCDYCGMVIWYAVANQYSMNEVLELGWLDVVNLLGGWFSHF